MDVRYIVVALALGVLSGRLFAKQAGREPAAGLFFQPEGAAPDGEEPGAQYGAETGARGGSGTTYSETGDQGDEADEDRGTSGGEPGYESEDQARPGADAGWGASGGVADEWSGTSYHTLEPAVVTVSDQDNTQLPTFAEAFMNSLPVHTIHPGVSVNVAAANERAILDAIAWAEGTYGRGDNGYNILFGGGTFGNYVDHPRQRFSFTDKKGRRLTTSAAGRYQFLIRTWDELASKLQLTDFGPDAQDRAALELIRQRGALGDVRAGRIEQAITKIKPIWASLPGAGYAQPERSLTAVVARFQQAGGTLEA